MLSKPVNTSLNDHKHRQRCSDRDVLERLESAIHPDVDGGADGGGLTVKSVGYNQEVVRSNGEELPVIRSGCGQTLVHLKHLTRQKRK